MNFPLIKEKGFSLVEVLIALTVFSVGVLALLGLFPTISELNKSSTLTNQALALAQSKVDEITVNNTFIGTQSVWDYPAELPGGYRRWWGEAEPGGNGNMQQIRVQCYWIEDGRPRNVILSSIIAP